MATVERNPERLRAVETTAFAGVFTRETTLFRRVWPSTTFASIVEPTINLIAFGFGFGAQAAAPIARPWAVMAMPGPSSSISTTWFFAMTVGAARSTST